MSLNYTHYFWKISKEEEEFVGQKECLQFLGEENKPQGKKSKSYRETNDKNLWVILQYTVRIFHRNSESVDLGCSLNTHISYKILLRVQPQKFGSNYVMPILCLYWLKKIQKNCCIMWFFMSNLWRSLFNTHKRKVNCAEKKYKNSSLQVCWQMTNPLDNSFPMVP